MIYKFTYNEPMFGDIEIEGPELDQDEVIKAIEQSYPEAVDIEILN